MVLGIPPAWRERHVVSAAAAIQVHQRIIIGEHPGFSRYVGRDPRISRPLVDQLGPFLLGRLLQKHEGHVKLQRQRRSGHEEQERSSER
jgi:hypothetical protein